MTASKIIAIAEAELEYYGKKNKTDDTSIKAAPNGTGKYNKYSRDLAACDPQYYNTKKDGADWCCIFVDWLFYQAAGKNRTEATAVKPLAGGGCGAGCSYAAAAYKTSTTTTPTVGAQVFYKDRLGKYAHTGLVAAINGDEITTIEGNWGYKVSKRTVRIGEYYAVDKKTDNDQTIACFGLPAYEPEPEPSDEEKNQIIAELTAALATANDEIARKDKQLADIEAILRR